MVVRMHIHFSYATIDNAFHWAKFGRNDAHHHGHRLWRIRTVATSQPPPRRIFHRQAYQSMAGPMKLTRKRIDRNTIVGVDRRCPRKTLEKGEGVAGKSDRARVVVDRVNRKENALPVSCQEVSFRLLKINQE